MDHEADDRYKNIPLWAETMRHLSALASNEPYESKFSLLMDNESRSVVETMEPLDSVGNSPGSSHGEIINKLGKSSDKELTFNACEIDDSSGNVKNDSSVRSGSVSNKFETYSADPVMENIKVLDKQISEGFNDVVNANDCLDTELFEMVVEEENNDLACDVQNKCDSVSEDDCFILSCDVEVGDLNLEGFDDVLPKDVKNSDHPVCKSQSEICNLTVGQENNEFEGVINKSCVNFSEKKKCVNDDSESLTKISLKNLLEKKMSVLPVKHKIDDNQSSILQQLLKDNETCYPVASIAGPLEISPNTNHIKFVHPDVYDLPLSLQESMANIGPVDVCVEVDPWYILCSDDKSNCDKVSLPLCDEESILKTILEANTPDGNTVNTSLDHYDASQTKILRKNVSDCESVERFDDAGVNNPKMLKSEECFGASRKTKHYKRWSGGNNVGNIRTHKFENDKLSNETHESRHCVELTDENDLIQRLTRPCSVVLHNIINSKNEMIQNAIKMNFDSLYQKSKKTAKKMDKKSSRVQTTTVKKSKSTHHNLIDESSSQLLKSLRDNDSHFSELNFMHATRNTVKLLHKIVKPCHEEIILD